MIETRTETHKLKCFFTTEELLKLGERNAILQQELDQVEDEKKSMVAHFSSQMSIKKEEIRLTSSQLANKYEHRNVDCDIEFHTPDKGKKRVTRQDTNENWIENMSDIDWNLWNDKLVHELCDVAYNTPSEGMKTFTHKDRSELTFVEHMTGADFEKMQGKLFNDTETEIEAKPIVQEEIVEGMEGFEFNGGNGSRENPLSFTAKEKKSKKDRAKSETF